MPFTTKVALVSSLITLLITVTDGSVYTISDDRVRNIDITPVLGRGYSIMTDMYHSTCLVVEDTTTPSYNYNYEFKEYKSSKEAEKEFSAEASGKATTVQPVGFMTLAVIKGEFSASGSGSSKVTTDTHMVTATMRLERYYSSVREEVSPLANAAKEILDDQDYVGFFKACGPNYVRGIRRAQEVTAIFTFKTTSKENASQFASSMKVSVRTIGLVNSKTTAAAEAAGKSKFKSVSSSMTIKIMGWGVGLGETGAETFVATDLAGYQEVMKFAFKSMTQGENAHNIGMVYGIEVVPWVHNTAFQVAAKLGEEIIEIPMPRSLIPRAFAKDGTDTKFDKDSRDDFKCKEVTFSVDKYGYCCELEQLFDVATSTYLGVTADPTSSVCKPIRALDPSLIKDNMSNNGEFVSRMDSSLRYKMAQLGTLEKCISAVNSIPETFEHHVLHAQDTVKYDRVIDIDVSLAHLKLAVDPKNNYNLLKHMGREIDEWIEMYMSPCYAALFGSNVGFSPDVDVAYFMAYPWWHHDECMHLSCLTNNMRWDRKEGGCTPSVINGGYASDYDGDQEKYCARDNEDNDANACKYDGAKLKKYRDTSVTCWAVLPFKSVEYLMTHFCMPQITGKVIATAEMVTDDMKATCKLGTQTEFGF